MNVTNLDEKINDMLREVGEFYQVDQAYLFTFFPDLTIHQTCEWCGKGMGSVIHFLQEISASPTDWWMHHLLNREPILVLEVKRMASGTQKERELLEKQSIRSLFVTPLLSTSLLLGFLGIDSIKGRKIWREEHQETLQILANLAADVLIKVKNEEEINVLAFHDPLTGFPNRILFTDRLQQALVIVDRQVILSASCS